MGIELLRKDEALESRRAKIICTLGPATDAPHVLADLLDAGMDVARPNFSHGTPGAAGRRARYLLPGRQRRRTPRAPGHQPPRHPSAGLGPYAKGPCRP